MDILNLMIALSVLAATPANPVAEPPKPRALWVAGEGLSLDHQILIKTGVEKSIQMRLLRPPEIEQRVRLLADKVPPIDDQAFRNQLRRARRAFVSLKISRAQNAYYRALKEAFNHPLSLPNIDLLSRVYFEKSQVSKAKQKTRQADRELSIAVRLNPKLKPDPDRFGPPVIRAVQAAIKNQQRNSRYQVRVNRAPADAKVFINGGAVSESGVIELRGRGPHLLTAERIGYRAYVELIDLNGQAKQEIALVLKPAKGPVLAQQVLQKWRPAGAATKGTAIIERGLALQLARVAGLEYVVEAQPSTDGHVELRLTKSENGEIERSIRGRKMDWEPWPFAVLTEALAGRTLERPDLDALILAISAPSRVNANEKIEVIVQIRDSASQLRRLQAQCGDDLAAQRIAGIKEGALSFSLIAPADQEEVRCQVSGFNAEDEEIVVAPPSDKPLKIVIDDPIARPWYSRWYVWTAIVAAVAAGGAGAGYYGNRGPRPKEHQLEFGWND
jgi:hypothetical protein